MPRKIPTSGQGQERRRPDRTRKQRFQEIRGAITARSKRMRRADLVGVPALVMLCGHFKISFHPPLALGPRRGFNLSIWPGAKIDCGRMVIGDKVANVDWDQFDNIDILTFRSGPWETELLAMLRGTDDVLGFG